jgi:hypothetical protein
MSDRRNWGLIRSGPTFEALATTLVFFEDPGAATFGRSGKDGGQDARSGDGTRVFQAKYHRDASTAKVIADAKSEAAKVATYRSSEHARHGQWAGVTHWRLITNAQFNPADRQRWETEVVPLFADHGLIADYWEQADLDALLDKHPEVARSFFGSQTRAFLTLPEVREMLLKDEPFLQRDTPTNFVGRTAELEAVRSFLSSDRLFLVAHGAGGIGKTRLLVEAAEELAATREWQVLWANVATLESASTWFDGIVPERPTLLLVDEPDDDRVLRILIEQLGGRAARWKVALAVRSPKDPVLRFLFAPRIEARVQELAVGALSSIAAEEMCRDLLASGPLGSTADEWRQNTARELARRFSQHPIWLTLAIHVLEKDGDLTGVPQNAKELAEHYLDEVVGLQRQAPREQVLLLLRWVALLGAVNREDDGAVKLLVAVTGLKDQSRVLELLASLVDRRGLTQRGARNRLVELKPDVLRDHVLLQWLSVDVGYGNVPVQPSKDAKNLAADVRDAVLNGSVSSLARSVLVALARTEMLLRLSDRPVPLLDPLFKGIDAALPTASASVRVLLAEVLLNIAFVRPADTVLVSRSLRSSAVDTETVTGTLGSREISQNDVVLELAWLVFHAAMGAREAECQQVLEELCAIAESEAEIGDHRARQLPNDGKRAAQLIGRVLGGGPEFWGDFEEAAATIAVRLLDEVAEKPVSAAKEAVLNALLVPAAALEREQNWNEGYTFHIQRYVVLPSHPAWQTRSTIRRRIKELLARNSVPTATRLVLWRVFAKAHSSANQCRGRGDEGFNNTIHQELLDDLGWARSVLRRRRTDLQEMTVARELWQWHHSYDKDPALKSASDELDALYMSNDLVREFEPLLGRDQWEQRIPRASQKAEDLARAERAEQIGEFVDRAICFLRDDRKVYDLSHIAVYLGRHALTSNALRHFVKAALTEPATSPRAQFAIPVAAGWLTAVRAREAPDAAYQIASDLVDTCRTDELKTDLIRRLYGFPPRQDLAELSTAEHNFLRSLAPLFLRNSKGPEFIETIAWTLRHDWPQFRIVIDSTLDSIPTDQLAAAVTSLVDGVYWAVTGSEADGVPDGLATWLLDQLLRVPDLASPGDTLRWHVAEILQRIGRAPVEWLPKALACRRDMEAREGFGNVRALSRNERLSLFVTPISAAQQGDPAIARVARELVDFVSDTGTVGQYLPEVLLDVDPQGFVIAGEIARRIEAADDRECRRLARIASAYPIGGSVWRTIARPVIGRALVSSDPRPFFASLTNLSRSWSAAPGQVPDLFIQNVRSARERLESETDSAFRPFWEWHLALVEAELRQEEEDAKEERGE